MDTREFSDEVMTKLLLTVGPCPCDDMAVTGSQLLQYQREFDRMCVRLGLAPDVSTLNDMLFGSDFLSPLTYYCKRCKDIKTNPMIGSGDEYLK